MHHPERNVYRPAIQTPHVLFLLITVIWLCAAVVIQNAFSSTNYF